MDCTTHRAEIKLTLNNVREFSFSEKKDSSAMDEKMNRFLDAILDLKSFLSTKTEKIEALIPRLESLTWFTDLDNGCLMLVNDLISSAKDLHSSLIRQYAQMDNIRMAGMAKKEIKEFKAAIDDFKEVYSDLESVFFFLPEMPDFVETTKIISLV
jgi:hypothetical protein